MSFSSLLRKFIVRKDGATAIEYGLIAAGIALVILPAVQLIGTHSSDTYDKVSVALAAPGDGDIQTGSCTPYDPCGAQGGGGDEDDGELPIITGGGPTPTPPDTL